MKKFNLNWQSVLLGMALCAVLFVFIGSAAAGPQSTGPTTSPDLQQRLQQRTMTATDVWEKCAQMDVKINRLREQMDYLLKNMERTWREDRQGNNKK